MYFLYFYYLAPPRVIFTPPSTDGSYEVELGRRFSLSCTLDENIFPVPLQFSSSRLSQRGRCQCDSYSRVSKKVTCLLYCYILWIYNLSTLGTTFFPHGKTYMPNASDFFFLHGKMYLMKVTLFFLHCKMYPMQTLNSNYWALQASIVCFKKFILFRAKW